MPLSSKVVGIDLASVKEGKTGLAFLKDFEVETFVAYSDEDIASRTVQAQPSIVAIDAPLSLPRSGALRSIERELMKIGLRAFPPLGLESMRKLTLRGIKLKEVLESYGLKVIETHPKSARKVLNMPTKPKINDLIKTFIQYGIKGDLNKPNITIHELDAITCAIVGKLFLEGKTVSLGDPSEQQIVIPNPALFKPSLDKEV